MIGCALILFAVIAWFVCLLVVGMFSPAAAYVLGTLTTAAFFIIAAIVAIGDSNG